MLKENKQIFTTANEKGLHKENAAQRNEATCSGSHTLLCSDKDHTQKLEELKFC